MTSNVGYTSSKIGFNSSKSNSELKETFSIPFINRIDSIFNFDYLNYNDIKLIVKDKLKNIRDKYKSKNIKVKISNTVVDNIIELSNYKDFGARKIDKIIKNKIESQIINDILEDKQNIVIKELNFDKVIN